MPVTDLGDAPGLAPSGPKFYQIHTVFGNFGKIIGWRRWRVGVASNRNPRSAPDCIAGDDIVSELLKFELLFKIYVGKMVKVRTYLSQIWQNLS